jgi:hypothetical protein
MQAASSTQLPTMTPLLAYRGLPNAELRDNIPRLYSDGAPKLEEDVFVGEVGREALHNNTAVSSAVSSDKD